MLVLIRRFVPELFEYQWITLCAATCLTLLSLLLNLARGLRILYLHKRGRWSMRAQHVDNRTTAVSGAKRFLEALRRLILELFGQYSFRKRFK